MPGSLRPGDLEVIAAHQGRCVTDLPWLAAHFQASDGAKTARIADDGRVIIEQHKSIVPATTATGECVFFQGGLCSIHEVSPAGCRFVDMHMSVEEATPIVKGIIQDIVVAHQRPAFSTSAFGYPEQAATLAAMGRLAPPIAERRAAFNAAELELRRAGAARIPAETLDA